MAVKSDVMLGSIHSANDRVRFGVFLHSAADSFSHSGFTWRVSPVNDRKSLIGSTEIGHLEAGEAPDIPYEDANKAARAAKYLYQLIRSFAGTAALQPVGDESLEAELRFDFAEATGAAKERGHYWWLKTWRRFGLLPTAYASGRQPRNWCRPHPTVPGEQHCRYVSAFAEAIASQRAVIRGAMP
jgi:hypothetical protein